MTSHYVQPIAYATKLVHPLAMSNKANVFASIHIQVTPVTDVLQATLMIHKQKSVILVVAVKQMVERLTVMAMEAVDNKAVPLSVPVHLDSRMMVSIIVLNALIQCLTIPNVKSAHL